MAENKILPGLDALGISYNARGRYLESGSFGQRVVELGRDFSERTQFGGYPSKTVQYTGVQRGTVEKTYGQNIAEYANNLKGKFKINGKYGFFEAEAEASFSQAERSSQELQFMTMSRTQQGYKLSLIGTAEDWWENLTSAFRRDVMKMQPEKLFHDYGTHVSTSILVGGKSQCSFTARKSSMFGEKEFSAAVSVNYETLKAGIAVSAKESAAWTKEQASISSNYGLQLIGGNPDCDSIDEWKKTVAGNPVLIDFTQNGLTPLYEFCPDEERRKVLHDAFDRMFAIAKDEIVLRIFSQDSTTVRDHPEVTCLVDRNYKVISGGAECQAVSGPGQLLTAMYPKEMLNPRAWVALSKDHKQSSPGKVTAYCVALYDPKDEWEVQVFRNKSPQAQKPLVSVSVDPGYVMVGGGAHCIWEGFGNLLQASYPQDETTWTASATDQTTFSLCTLEVFAIGLRRKDGSDPGLTSHIFSATSSITAHPRQEVAFGDTDFAMIAGGARIVTPAENYLLGSMPRADGGAWIATGKDHRVSSPAAITSYGLGVKGIRVRYAKSDREVAG